MQAGKHTSADYITFSLYIIRRLDHLFLPPDIHGAQAKTVLGLWVAAALEQQLLHAFALELVRPPQRPSAVAGASKGTYYCAKETSYV